MPERDDARKRFSMLRFLSRYALMLFCRADVAIYAAHAMYKDVERDAAAFIAAFAAPYCR